MTRLFRLPAIFLLLVLAANALGGGWLLITDPGGGSIGISIELLEGTPFDDYLVPGIILFIVNGLLSVAAATMTAKKVRHYPWFIMLQGCVLIGWLTGELILNGDFFDPVLHYSLYAVGILLIASGFITWKCEGYDSA
jgi:hypothetical protein